MSVVDSAVHVWKADPAYPFAEGVSPPTKDATPEELLAMMDKNGVDKTVIVQPICYKWDNSFVLDTIKKWPDRFAAVARVDPEDLNGVQRIEELTGQGFVGVRFGPVQQEWWETPLMLDMLEKAAELRVPVLLFLGKDGPSTFPWLLPVLDKVPQLQVVIDHMADTDPRDPKQVEALLELASRPNIYIKVSHVWALSQEEYPWADSMAMAKQVISKFGAGRVMMALDWPVCQMPAWPGGNTDYDTTIKLFTTEFGFLSAEERAGLLGATAEGIWWKR